MWVAPPYSIGKEDVEVKMKTFILKLLKSVALVVISLALLIVAIKI